jgi:site-specific DNA recombinase
MKPSLPCAIYTRKSSEEGLEQGFNSLDAQREACEAFIQSQKALGWKPAACFDDGGFSGGNTDRPGLQKLLAEVAAKRIRIIVVYKVDRLTRSLADFAKLVELFDANDVSFVSVTQSFNTTSSMGRLTLNVLLSFAQFEREVTGERIRDKIAASKRKGMWMGGNAPIGYLPKDRTLVIDESQAQRVREIYRLYLEMGNVRLLMLEVTRRGWLTPERQTRRQGASGNRPFSRGHLYRILSNPIYVGRVPHKDTTYEGNHPAIVDIATWEAVQSQLADNVQGRRTARAAQPSMLNGRLWDEQGHRLTSSHAAKGTRRYRYYVRPGSDPSQQPLRVPAQELEDLVVKAIVAFLRDPQRLMQLIGHLDASKAKSGMADAAELADQLESLPQAGLGERLSALIDRVTIRQQNIEVTVHTAAIWPNQDKLSDLPGATLIEVPVQLKRCGMAGRLIVPGADAPVTRKADPKMVALLVKAQAWFAHLRSGRCRTVQEVAEVESVTGSHATRVMYLALLAPDIVQAIARGEQPSGLDSTRLMKSVPLPIDWQDQRVRLGFAA